MVMTKTRRLLCLSICVCTLTILSEGLTSSTYAAEIFRAGVASTVITPEQPMWMSGYAARTKPSEGKVHDLHAKALALEDSQGKRLVIVTVDLLGIPRPLRDRLERKPTNVTSCPRNF